MIFRNLNLDRATAPARDRGRYAGSRASRSGVFHWAPRAPLAPPDVLRHFPVVQPIIEIKVLRCGAAIWFKTLRISEESKFSDRDRARAGRRALRVIARMEAWFWGTPWMTCLASPDSSGSVSVVPKTLWVKFSRHGGAGRRLKNCCSDCADRYSRRRLTHMHGLTRGPRRPLRSKLILISLFL